MATFEGMPHITKIILSFLKREDLLNCRILCKSWKQILDNPKFWLKKLNAIGQPENVTEKWTNLIGQAEVSGFDKKKLAYCLMLKFCKISQKPLLTESSEFHLKLPPIFNALCQNTPSMEDTIRFIVKHDKELYIPVITCFADQSFVDVKLKINWNNFEHETDIIGEAVSRGHSLSIIKYLVSEMNAIEENDIEKSLHYSVQRNDLEMFKFLNELTEHMLSKSIFKYTISSHKPKILQYLLEMYDPNGYEYDQNMTLLHKAAGETILNILEDNCQCVEMLKLLIPKMENINAVDKKGKTALNLALSINCSCQVEKVKLLAGITDLDKINDEGKPQFNEFEKRRIKVMLQEDN